MWNTPTGIRILRPREGRLFLAAADALTGRIQAGDLPTDFPQLFTELTDSQRTAEIKTVTQALLASSEVVPSTAVHDATIYSVFQQLKSEIVNEVDGNTTQWRKLTFQVLESVVDFQTETVEVSPTVDSNNYEAWDDAVERLVDQILWDRDFEFADSFLDADPRQAAVLRQVLGIDDDYFSSAAEDIAT